MPYTIMHLIYASGYALFAVNWSSGNAFVCGVEGLRFNSWAGQSNAMLPMARHHCGISSEGVVLLGRNDVEMGPAYSLHASMYYSKHNEKFDLISFMISFRVAVFRFIC